MAIILDLDTYASHNRKQRDEHDGCTLLILDASSVDDTDRLPWRVELWWSAANKLWKELVELNQAQHPKTGRYLHANELQKLTKGLQPDGLDRDELYVWDDLPARTKQYVARHVCTAFVQYTTSQGMDKDGIDGGINSLIFDGDALPTFYDDYLDGARLEFPKGVVINVSGSEWLVNYLKMGSLTRNSCEIPKFKKVMIWRNEEKWYATIYFRRDQVDEEVRERFADGGLELQEESNHYEKVYRLVQHMFKHTNANRHSTEQIREYLLAKHKLKIDAKYLAKAMDMQEIKPSRYRLGGRGSRQLRGYLSEDVLADQIMSEQEAERLMEVKKYQDQRDWWDKRLEEDRAERKAYFDEMAAQQRRYARLRKEFGEDED